ncbi:helix-turn-helix transcriptional regulator [Kitasatospora purpeofusca]|uniref:helix-turn-helix transcriptional regulator n=1 Tax=Kitasatospora purpeofusca TaxID=67352 RepID=UPI00224E923E|nr:helix-turn-helix transcriptional regulator [Kitasatospora purpeofusca]MCX4685076.1 helix-turn-helix transcriptional regulator [Kitasatospora purpeofusca]WTA54374.1 helix-turn-helix transcriptional regulator [Kitasatospora purpeofusca]
MDGRAELGAFLRSRRARIKPEDAGLARYGERRRVPGLRREELAQLAGVSVDYYVRFEQGRGETVSDTVIGSVATALALTGTERTHLFNLARAISPGPAVAPQRQRLRPGQQALLDSMTTTPAYVVGRRTDIIGFNALYAELLGSLATVPPAHRNTAWLVFLDDDVRGRYVNWESKARNVVAYLRMDAGRHPGDPALAALAEELTNRSEDFRRLWADHEVADRTHGGYSMRHPTAGDLTLNYESFQASDDPDLSLIAYSAEPGSPSHAALNALAEHAPLRY